MKEPQIDTTHGTLPDDVVSAMRAGPLRAVATIRCAQCGQPSAELLAARDHLIWVVYRKDRSPLALLRRPGSPRYPDELVGTPYLLTSEAVVEVSCVRGCGTLDVPEDRVRALTPTSRSRSIRARPHLKA